MSNWQTLKLGKVTILVKDGTHGTHKNVENGTFLLSAQNIENGNIIINENDRKISGKDFELIHRNYKMQDNDILITIVGTLGRCAILKNYNNNFTFQRSVAIVRFDNEKILPKFAYYQIQTNKFQAELRRRESKGAQSGVYLGELAKIPIVVPDLETQQKIVQILDTYTSTIELQDSLITKNEKLFKGYRSKLLLAYPGEKVLLGEVASMCSGGTPNSKNNNYYGGTIPWVSIADMTSIKDHYIYDTAKHLSEEGFNSLSSIKIHPKGSILYAMYASIGECVIAGNDMTSSQAILGIKCGSGIYNKYLYYYLTNEKQKIKTLGQQGTQSNVNAKIVKSIQLLLPNIELQKEIVHKLDTQAEIINQYKQKKFLYIKQYKYLLNHLINGDFDLSNIKLENGKEYK